MRKPLSISTLIIASSFLLACNSDKGVGTADTGNETGTDGATQDTSGLTCSVPSSGYGTAVGSKIAPFTVAGCSSGDEQFSFYDQQFCSAEITVLSFAAGWCGPCRQESEELKERVVDHYAGQPVRVVQVIVDGNAQNSAPTSAFCDTWVSTYGLTGSDQLKVVRDTTDVTNVYYPNASLPTTLFVDGDGVILDRIAGADMGLNSIRQRIDQYLVN